MSTNNHHKIFCDLDLQTYQQLYQASILHPESFWSDCAKAYLHWDKHWDVVCKGNFKNLSSLQPEQEEEAKVEWFKGGMLNASVNCLDRHLPQHADKPAIIWQGDNDAESLTWTYAELYEQVCRFANVLLKQGIKIGDRVCIYLPLIPEAIVAMLACARIGAIHTVVFAGFSAQALHNRLQDAKCRVLITADESLRGGKPIPLKANVDIALQHYPQLQRVIVIKHTGRAIHWQSDRDSWYHDLMADAAKTCPPISMEATAPLFILYTSGSTGSPKGILHATGGYLLHAAISFDVVFQHRLDDIFWCTADIGWITGHSYVVYGPLANAATLLIYAGIPTYPTPARCWEIIDKYKVTIFYTAPTLIRTLMREGDAHVMKTSRRSLRLLGSVGEPLNPEAWRWYNNIVGAQRCPIIDTWWQTETGGIMMTPFPNLTPTKPGSVGWPFFGIAPAILDEKNQIIAGAGRGDLVITQPWPGMLQGIYGDTKRFSATYFAKYPGYYFTGDGAYRDETDCYWMTGRVDDVVNVSGHRLGTAEIESALVAHPAVAEAAVVGYSHEIKGEGIYAFVSLLVGIEMSDDLDTELRIWVRREIGAIAVPEKIHFTAELPKTRSGKIMRRILRKIAQNDLDDLGDVSTLANPEIVEMLIKNMND